MKETRPIFFAFIIGILIGFLSGCALTILVCYIIKLTGELICII